MSFAKIDIQNIFPTPLITASFPREVSAGLNAELVPMLLKKATEMDSAHITNIGGWQSDTRLMEWGGKPVQAIAAALAGLIRQYTLNLHNPGFAAAIDWKIYGWANVNRKGDLNVVHTHPGAYWSAVYYVQTEEGVAGEIEFVDPRGTMPIMYSPHLRLNLEGCRSCGGHELRQPKAGDCYLFPSWLPHAVMPHTGERKRISLAFNFSI